MVCDWLSLERLDISALSQNPRAFSFLLDNPGLINWGRFSANPSCYAIEHLRSNPDRIDTHWLVHNPSGDCLPLIEERLHLLNRNDWAALSRRDYAIELLRLNPERINWFSISGNPAIFEKVGGKMQFRDWIPVGKLNFDVLCSNPNAIDYVLQFPNKISAAQFSLNPNAVPHLKRLPHLINWKTLALNPCPLAIQMLKENPSQIAYELLCSNNNPEIVSLFQGVPVSDTIISKLAVNEGVFVLDRETMRRNGEQLEFEFVTEVMHPRRMFADPEFDRIEHLFGD